MRVPYCIVLFDLIVEMVGLHRAPYMLASKLIMYLFAFI
jgi:hypothetical protein